jgi:DNA-binding NtrC family response regulator
VRRYHALRMSQPDPMTLSASYRAVSVTFRTLVRRSKVMNRLLDDAERISQSDVNVLLLGETGTGKNLIAQAIHNASRRGGGPFVSLNCSALPDSLLEAELFGAEEGAYTDSRKLRRGRFELAQGGTLFLDEIGDLSLPAQAKILHALEYREFTRVGGEKILTADVRFIAATNVPLESRVKAGQFRSDLFWRLNEVALRVPALRERAEDVSDLATAFIEEACQKAGKQPRKLDKAAAKALSAHTWPGNVRELRGVIRSGLARCAGDTLTLEEVQAALANGPNELLAPQAASGPMPGDLSLAAAEASHIRRVLDMTGWVKSEAARILDISRPTLDRKIEAFNLHPEAPRS